MKLLGCRLRKKAKKFQGSPWFVKEQQAKAIRVRAVGIGCKTKKEQKNTASKKGIRGFSAASNSRHSRQQIFALIGCAPQPVYIVFHAHFPCQASLKLQNLGHPKVCSGWHRANTLVDRYTADTAEENETHYIYILMIIYVCIARVTAVLLFDWNNIGKQQHTETWECRSETK
jgi:hypothetical protein